MKTTTVNLGVRSYPVHLGHGLSSDLPAMLGTLFAGRKLGLVTNTTLRSLYADTIERWKSSLSMVEHVVPDGERHKNVETWSSIIDAMLAAGLDRKSALVAFGGGVVGDMTGFAAAALLRGIDYVQVPTTLLAMIDSSIGGKTGVNHPLGKNLIGAFHQPRAVWVDTAYLDTLPPREYVAGWGEMFKNAFIGGADMFDFITEHNGRILGRDQALVAEAIGRSIAIKAAVVSEDERESGKRALLNFGHTFGHALERHFHYNGILHGEAVLWGIACAIELGKRVGSIDAADLQKYDVILKSLILPPLPAKPEAEKLYLAMSSDKKAENGDLTFVVPTTPGTSRIRRDIRREQVVEAMQSVFTRFS